MKFLSQQESIANTCVINSNFVMLEEAIEGRNSLATFNCSPILSIIFIPN